MTTPAGASRRVLRFMPEWGTPYPLFESEHENYVTEPADYGLSTALADRLALWTRHWQRHLHEDHGWDSATAEMWSQAEGGELLRLVRAEVEGFADVVDESDWLWTPPWWQRLPFASWLSWEWTRRRRRR